MRHAGAGAGFGTAAGAEPGELWRLLELVPAAGFGGASVAWGSAAVPWIWQGRVNADGPATLFPVQVGGCAALSLEQLSGC